MPDETSGVDKHPARRGFVTRALLKAVLFYQNYLSPLKMGSSCRFEPTCSAYALDALRERGAIIGVALTAARLAKCGPWHPGGYDPVPVRNRDSH
ncbi:membrane protein insertion efficiency factor YidD [Staphylococcus chromogenes]|nr:membrane protein insertion efficiency factor YidD [Staphylococcus chromogenes]